MRKQLAILARGMLQQPQALFISVAFLTDWQPKRRQSLQSGMSMGRTGTALNIQNSTILYTLAALSQSRPASEHESEPIAPMWSPSIFDIWRDDNTPLFGIDNHAATVDAERARVPQGRSTQRPEPRFNRSIFCFLNAPDFAETPFLGSLHQVSTGRSLCPRQHPAQRLVIDLDVVAPRILLVGTTRQEAFVQQRFDPA